MPEQSSFEEMRYAATTVVVDGEYTWADYYRDLKEKYHRNYEMLKKDLEEIAPYIIE